ncbi:hypothetical protein GCM10028791_17960 [Echinicola sediminis]
MSSKSPKSEMLFMIALIISLVLKIVLKIMPYRYRRVLQGKLHQKVQQDHSKEQKQKISAIKNIMLQFEKYPLWKAECYNLALTAKMLLKIVGVKSTIYIGVKKLSKDEFTGHAWLMIGDDFIVGGEISPDYNVLSFYS